MTEETNSYPSIKPTPVTPTIESKEVSETIKVNTTTSEVTEKPASMSDCLKDLLEINDDHFNIPEDSKFLNEFILGEMKRQDLSDTKETYKGILDELIKKTNIPEELDIYAKLERLSEYARIQKKLIDASIEREEFLKKDPKDMNSKELRKFIGTK